MAIYLSVGYTMSHAARGDELSVGEVKGDFWLQSRADC